MWLIRQSKKKGDLSGNPCRVRKIRVLKDAILNKLPRYQLIENGFREPRMQFGSARNRKLEHAENSAAALPAGKRLCVLPAGITRSDGVKQLRRWASVPKPPDA